MHIRRLATHVEVLAPAKINLFLEVLAKRPDGYHELETLLVAVTLFDTLLFIADEGDQIAIDCRWASGLGATEVAGGRQIDTTRGAIFSELPEATQNLAWRAAAALREAAGVKRGAKIRLVKRIPAAAGLGGASSDAAAALLAANEAWNLHWPRQRLLELAAEVGSDVPFFLSEGAAVGRGRGEQTEAIAVPRLHLVIVRPPAGLSTARVYQAWRPEDPPAVVDRLIAALVAGNPKSAGQNMRNGLQPAAARLTPWIDRLEDELERQGASGHQMSGSGSSYFGLCHSARHARRLAARLRARNLGASWAATTCTM